MNKIIGKDMPIQAKAAMWYSICNILQKGLMLLATPVFTRLMTTEQYGVFTIYQSWLSIIQIFTTLNLTQCALNIGLAKYKDDKQNLLVSFQSLNFVTTGAVFFLYIIFSRQINILFELPTHLVVLIFIQMFFEPIYFAWAAEQRFEYKYKGVVYVTICISLLSVVTGVLGVVLCDNKVLARIVPFVLLEVFAGVCIFIKNTVVSKKIFDFSYWKFALNISLPLVPHFISTSILNQADRIMIGKMIGTAEAAIYGVAYSISMMMMMIVNAILNSFSPFLIRSLQEKNYDQLRATNRLMVLTLACFSLIAVIVGPELLKIFASEEYYDARWIIPPVAVSIFFIFVYNELTNIEAFYNKTVYTMVVSSLVAVFNIFLNYIFMNIFGYVAAGYTTLFCYILFVMLHYVLCKNIMKSKGWSIDAVLDKKHLILTAVLVICAMITFSYLYDFLLIRYCILLLIILIAGRNRKKFLIM